MDPLILELRRCARSITICHSRGFTAPLIDFFRQTLSLDGVDVAAIAKVPDVCGRCWMLDFKDTVALVALGNDKRALCAPL